MANTVVPRYNTFTFHGFADFCATIAATLTFGLSQSITPHLNMIDSILQSSNSVVRNMKDSWLEQDDADAT